VSPEAAEALDAAWEKPSGSHVLLSSERQDWQTPRWFIDLVRRVGPIALDPATSVDNPTGARGFYAQGFVDCGLAADWSFRASGGLTFCNPPYGAHLSGPVEPDHRIMRKGKLVGVGRGWAQKIVQHHGETIVLVPVRTETEWWRTLFAWADLVLFWSSPEHGCRISFVNPDTGKPQQGSNLASTVFYRAPMYGGAEGCRRFRDVFSPHGTLVHGGGGGAP
jgi:phage N-6-adenine-methyltransferase